MYEFLKKLSRPFKYGKLAKGIAAIYSLVKRKSLPEGDDYISQSVGMILLPIVYLLFEPLTEKLPAKLREKIPLVFYGGLTVGSSLGSAFSSTFLKKLPSSFNGLIGAGIGICLITAGLLGFDLIVSRMEKVANKRNNSKKKANKQRSTDLRAQFYLGMEAGLLIGSTLGASLEIIHPTLGIAGSAVGSVLGTCVGIAVSLTAPRLFKKLFQPKSPNKNAPKEKMAPTLTSVRKSIGLGTTLGGCLGVVIGTFLFPVIGSVIVGILFAGIGGAVAGASAYYASKQAPTNRNAFTAAFQKSNLSHLILGMKVGIATGTLIGAVIGNILCPGFGLIAGAAIGALLGTALGTVPSLLYLLSKRPSPLGTEQQETQSADKSKQKETGGWVFLKPAKLGFSYGSAAGALIGAGIGSIVPGLGTVLGGLVGAFFGGLIGITIAVIIKRVALSKQFKKARETSAEKDQAKIIERPEHQSYGKISHTMAKLNTPEAKIQQPPLSIQDEKVETDKKGDSVTSDNFPKIEFIKPRPKPRPSGFTSLSLPSKSFSEPERFCAPSAAIRCR